VFKDKPQRFTPISLQKSRPEKRLNVHIFRLFDSPLWKDWLAWLNVVVLAVRTSTALHEPGADVYLVVLTDAFGFLLFGAIPGVIRRYLRKRRASSAVNGGGSP
jgi:hypothetical protein